jgi:hypothetical protein
MSRHNGRVPGDHNGFAHLTLCIHPGGKALDCYPEGDRQQIERGLRLLFRTIEERFGGSIDVAIPHITGTCGEQRGAS